MRYTELPPPETLIDLDFGHVTALMFYYAGEGDDIRNIAAEQGFECEFLGLESDNPELHERYLEDDGQLLPEIMTDWQPTRDGWLLGGKWDTDDGPFAVFIRKKAA